MKKVEFGFCGFDNLDGYRKWYRDALDHSANNGILSNEEVVKDIMKLSSIVYDEWSTIGAILDNVYNYHWNFNLIDAVTRRLYGEGLEEANEKLDAAIQRLSEIMDYKRPE